MYTDQYSASDWIHSPSDCKVPEFSHEEPSAVKITASAALLSSVVAREQMLGTQLYVLGTFAHDREPIGRNVGRRYGPGRAAPSLIMNAGYVAWPARPGVKLPRQCIGIVNASHRVHFVHLRERKQSKKASLNETYTFRIHIE